MDNKIAKDLIDAVKTIMKQQKTGYETSASVVRLDGNTAYVHIDGGVAETPATMSV